MTMPTDAPAPPAAPELSGNAGELGEPPAALTADQLKTIRTAGAAWCDEATFERIFATLDAERARAEAAERRVRELEARDEAAGDWFYPEGDTESEFCQSSAMEVIGEMIAWPGIPVGMSVVGIDRAARLPPVYALVHVFTEEEKDQREDDEEWTYRLFATRAMAEAALAGRGV